MTKKTTKKTTSQKEQGNKGGMSATMMAGAAGAAIGAGIGGVTAAALSNEKTRGVITDVVANIGDYVADAKEVVRENSGKLEAASNKVANSTHQMSESLAKK